MKWRSILPIGLLGIIALASCECDHEEDISAISELHVGSVVCADGTVLSEKRFEESDKEAMGIVFHVDSDNELGNLGYAVYIHDMEPLAFADTLGVDQETSASLSEEDGNENTYSLFHSENVASPMAIKVFDMWRYGQSAYVPSVRQLAYLFQNRYRVNERITAVGGTPVSLEPGDCWLWSSTEVEGQKESKAWLYSMQSGFIQETPKDQPHKFRPVISIKRSK